MFGQGQDDDGDNLSNGGGGFIGDAPHGQPSLVPSPPIEPPDLSALDDTAGAEIPHLNDASNVSNTPDVPLPQSPDVPESTSLPTLIKGASAGDTPIAGDLIAIKQQALQQLSPLVSHLDQTPEEKFKTTMMMIQASDDQSMIGIAFETAKDIIDDKTRAQALLDVINEINYFTQQHHN